jgi:hypothetical protein
VAITRLAADESRITAPFAAHHVSAASTLDLEEAADFAAFSRMTRE